jgi:adenosylcobalamin-dependent ribonucleoside-triphosphate reductase
MLHKDIEFNLTDTFLSKYRGKQPKWGPLGLFTFRRTYARVLEDGKLEEFWQCLQRVVEATFLVQKIHCTEQHIPWDNRKAQISAQEMFKRMWTFKFLPPGRGLANMGAKVMWERGGACLNNCGFVSTKDLDTDFSGPFTWLMSMSMHGCGVGFDTVGSASEVLLRRPRMAREAHVAEDSREGWVDCLRRVLDAYTGSDTLPKEWDLSQIRPEGSPIKTFGGIAPGHWPLEKMIDKVQEYLQTYQEAEKPIDSTAIVDLMNFAGEAVVSGGVRRTAELALGVPWDEEFLRLKSKEHMDNPWLARWASNNTLDVDVGTDYTEHAKSSALTGDPGYWWHDNARKYGRLRDSFNGKDKRVMGCNPCGEQSLENKELCNLVETFPANHDSPEDYMRTLKFAYMYAKTVTLIKTHSKQTNAVMQRNRRIGLSQSGIIQQINKVRFREHMNWCDQGYAAICDWDDIYSEWLCVSRSIKKTTVKPSGTVSLLVGATPGIHYPHSKYYIRRVRVPKQSGVWKQMKEAGYKVEPDKNLSESTMVVEFPVEEKQFDRKKADVSIWEQLELAANMQYWWSDNQVSITVTVKPEEAKDLARAISMYETRLKGVSFLPIDPSQQFEQPPYEEITKTEYTKRTRLIKKLKLAISKEVDRSSDIFCDGDSCAV